MTAQKSLVALATYNELENLPSLVDAIEQALPGADLLVVDDNSPDGTGRWCDERATGDARFNVVHREGKLGLGSATLAAFQWAQERGYPFVATMDADWSHDPADLPKLMALLETADVAIGSRYCPGGEIEGWPLSRRVVSRVMNSLTRLLLRVPVKDSSGAFRAYRTRALDKIDLARISSTGYAYLEEMVFLLSRSGAQLQETPIMFRERQAGRSKAGLGEALGKLRMLLRLLFSRN